MGKRVVDPIRLRFFVGVVLAEHMPVAIIVIQGGLVCNGGNLQVKGGVDTGAFWGGIWGVVVVVWLFRRRVIFGWQSVFGKGLSLMKGKKLTDDKKLSRRSFVRDSLATLGAMAGVSLGGEKCQVKGAAADNTSKILNYNPKMGYRRLGKTGLMFSEVSLGGHWKDRHGDRYWDEFKNDKAPEDVAKNRTEVIRACIDAGINYVDIGTSAECVAYGAALEGKREKMFVCADIAKLSARKARNCTVKKLTFGIEQCCRLLQTDYLDLWRSKADMYGRSTDAHVEAIIETFEKAQKAGKVRFLGISSHRRPWLQRVIETFDQVQVVSFPCTAKTKEKGKGVRRDNITEVEAGHESDTTQSIFESVRQHDVGVVAIKPFMGGSLFESCGKVKFPVAGTGSADENDLARLTLQCILANDAVTTTVPGLTTVHEVENAARASYERRVGLTEAERKRLWEMTERQWANLPEDYVWLREWESV